MEARRAAAAVGSHLHFKVSLYSDKKIWIRKADITEKYRKQIVQLTSFIGHESSLASQSRFARTFFQLLISTNFTQRRDVVHYTTF